MTDAERRGQRGVERLALMARLKSRPCADCRRRFPPAVMEFDHVRGRKIRPVANMKYYKLERLMKEIAKCDLVCSNCHAERTRKKAQYR